MSGWETVFEEQIEGRPVTLKVYRSDDEDEDQDTGSAIRVVTTLRAEAVGRPLIVEPGSLADLQEELVEIGFSPQAAATIASHVPQ